MKRKAISPVIATILLISIVVIIALIVFLWLRGMTEETITKFGGKNVKLVCGDVMFEASYSGGKLYISNTGNVPIFKMNMKIDKGTSFSTITFNTVEDLWPELGLNQGGTFSVDIGEQVNAGEEITIIPVLAGSTKDGEKTYACEEMYGQKILIE